MDLLDASTDDAYAFTHALVYATDFGRIPLPSNLDSGMLLGRDAAKTAKLDVKGVQKLKLVTTSAGDGGNSDHGDWADAKVS